MSINGTEPPGQCPNHERRSEKEKAITEPKMNLSWLSGIWTEGSKWRKK
jgi:hypothetical protein